MCRCLLDRAALAGDVQLARTTSTLLYRYSPNVLESLLSIQDSLESLFPGDCRLEIWLPPVATRTRLALRRRIFLLLTTINHVRANKSPRDS